MIRLTQAASTTPLEWFIVFRRSSPNRWAELLSFGRYKHVMCFGLVPAVSGWLFYDFGINATAVAVVPDERANGMLNVALDDAMVLKWQAPPVINGARLKPAFLCTSAVAHLTGVPSSALRPDAFLRYCLAAGAEIVIADENELRLNPESRPGAPG